EAEQETLGRHVALKVLPFTTATDPRCLARFRREARSAARLHHTNIVPVFDIGEREGVHYYAMQFIQGQGLDEVIVELQRLRTPRPTVLPCGCPPEPPSSLATSLAECLVSGEFRKEDLASGNPQTARPERSKASVLSDHSEFSARSDFQFYRSVARIRLQVAGALAEP